MKEFYGEDGAEEGGKGIEGCHYTLGAGTWVWGQKKTHTHKM